MPARYFPSRPGLTGRRALFESLRSHGQHQLGCVMVRKPGRSHSRSRFRPDLPCNDKSVVWHRARSIEPERIQRRSCQLVLAGRMIAVNALPSKMQVQGFSEDEVSDGFDEADEISVRTNSLADSELRGRPVHLAPLVCTVCALTTRKRDFRFQSRRI
jgi:hypothetical protein